MNDIDKPIGSILGVLDGLCARVLMKAIKALEKNEFPESLDYCA